MTATPATSEQMLLFPADESEALLYEQCDRYRSLPENAQRLLRGYMAIHRRIGVPTREDWIEASGLKRSTGYDVFKAHGADLAMAITEVLQVLGRNEAVYGALALVLAGKLVYRGLANGSKSPASLTASEIAVLRECAAMAGLSAKVSLGMLSTDSRGNASAAAAVTGSKDELAAILNELVEVQRRTALAPIPMERPEPVQAAAAAVAPAPVVAFPGAQEARAA